MMNRRDLLLSLAALPLCRAAAATEGSGVDEAIDRAVGFLLSRQSKDGSWRSEVYGGFRDGVALTPLVYLALTEAGVENTSAASWLAGSWRRFGESFPVHSISSLLQAGVGYEGAVEDLLSLQLSERGGWGLGDSEFGGWSYAPRLGRPGDLLPPFLQPNLTATALAIDGLAAAGLPHDHPAFGAAVQFVRRHQQPSGGFTETGPNGRTGKTMPYTSATADALRTLRHFGEDCPAVERWLAVYADIGDKRHLRYYTAASLAQTLEDGGASFSEALVAEQNDDGSWRNAMGEMREDDPLVATAHALRALV